MGVGRSVTTCFITSGIVVQRLDRDPVGERRGSDAALADLAGEARPQAAGYRVAGSDAPLASTCPLGAVGRVDTTGKPGQGRHSDVHPSGGGRGR